MSSIALHIERTLRDPFQRLFWLACVLAVAASWGGLAELVHRWNTQEEYGHGFFIPLIAGWLLWRRRQALADSFGAPAWLGPLLVAVSVVMLLMGELIALFVLIQFGFLLALVGLVLALGGYPLLRRALLPLAVLVFAIPLPYFVDAQLSWRLQLVSSQLGVEFLRAVGTSVYLEGNVIDLGAYKLQVVEACSGLRYLYPLLSIGFLMGYMYSGALWQRALLLLSTVPVTVLMNSLRIAVVGLLVERWGSDMADGFLHYFEGWIIFMACLLVLLGEIWLFERFGARRKVFDVLQVPEVSAVPRAADSVPRAPAFHPLYAAVLLLGAALAGVHALDGRQEIRPERSPLAAFPLALGEWRATEAALDAEVERALGLDDYLLADYRRDAGATVNFYVAYYGSQRKGVSPHSPQVCIPGGAGSSARSTGCRWNWPMARASRSTGW